MSFISKIKLKNIKCFSEEVQISFFPVTLDAASWTLILGNNGLGKTCLLRCIALCLCDHTRAAGLLTELSGNFIRNGYSESEIQLTITDDDREFTVTTRFEKSNDDTTELLSQSIEPSSGLRRAQIFACGYGAACGTIGNNIFEQYRIIDAVYTLFNYEARLQNPETALHRISRREGIDVEHLLCKIDRILMLEVGSTKLTSAGLQVRGEWGDFIPIGGIGDGYAATLSWVCDLLGWWYLRSTSKPTDAVRGIVLIDEIERHLHPSWQRCIIPQLAEEFPGVQFIGTTHAPLTVIGAASDADYDCQLVVLEHGQEGVVVRSGISPPPDQRADQVLTSYLFGLPWTTSNIVVQNIERYAELKRRPSPDMKTIGEINRLRSDLIKTLGEPETRLQSVVEKAVRETIDSLGQAERTDPEAMDFEIRRQIRDLLDF